MVKRNVLLACALALPLLLGCGRGHEDETADVSPSPTPKPVATAIIDETPAVSVEHGSPAAEPPDEDSAATPTADTGSAAEGSDSDVPAFCNQEDGEPIVALVGDKVSITLDRVLAIVADQERRLVPAGDVTDDASRISLMQKNRHRALDRLVQQQRYYLESIARDIPVDEDEVQKQLHELLGKDAAAQIAQAEARFKKGEISEQERDALVTRIEDEGIKVFTDRMHLTKPEFEEQVRRAIRVTRMMNEQVYGDVEPTTAEMVHFYKMNKSTLALTKNRADVFRVQVHASEGQTLEQARAHIEQMRKDLLQRLDGVEGDDRFDVFVPFIKEHSDGPNARGGGYVVIYGTEAIGTLEQSTIDMAYATNPYDVSPIFPIYNGYSFLMVKKVWPRIQTTFEELKDTIRTQLYHEKYDKRTEEFHAMLQKKYPVEICEGNLYLGLTANVPATANTSG